MTETPRPSLIRRLLPWAIAIALGVGVGWLVGRQIAPAGPDMAAAPQRPAEPAPPQQPAAPQAEQPARLLGPPIALAISNRDCSWGSDYEGYYRQAATILLHSGGQAGREADSVRVRVPDRPWNGLTITAVEAVYEGSGIIFAEPVATVRAALTGAGIRVAADGAIPLDEANDAVAVQAITATEGSARRYGATRLTCGA